MLQRFDQRLKVIPHDIWLKISQIDGLKGQWTAGARLSPQVLGRLKQSVLITSTGASTRIEGSELSDEEVDKLMHGLKIKHWRDRDMQEAQGYFDLLQTVFENAQHIRLSENTIKHFHKELLKYSDKDKNHRGEYKKQENKVDMINKDGQVIGTIFSPTPAYLTPKEMQELVDWTVTAWIEKKYHSLLITANFMAEFLSIHPFQDGNGRLSRILTNLLLLQQGYSYVTYVSHEKLIEDNKNDYYLALRQSQKTFKLEKENIQPWLNFFLDIILLQSHQAIDLISEKNIDKLLSPQQLKIWQYLQSVSEASPLQMSSATGVARPTVNQVVDKLIALDRIERLGLGRSTRYRIKS